MRCLRCKSDNSDGAKFCIECGTPLRPRCPQCGADMLRRAKFCAECGTPLAAQSPAAPAPPPLSYTPGYLAEKILTSDRPPRSVQAWVATAPTRDFREAHWEAFAMQTEHQRYVHRRPMRQGHITAIFGEAEYTADPGPFFLSTTVRLFP